MRAGERVSRPTTHASRLEVADFRSKLRNNTGASAERTPSMRSPAHGIRRRPDPSRIIRRALLPARAQCPCFATQPTRSTKQARRVAASTPAPKEKPPDLGHEPPLSCPRRAGRTRNPCGSMPARRSAATLSRLDRQPLAMRVALRPRPRCARHAPKPDIDDEAGANRLNQGAPAGWLSIVCLGDYRRPGAIVVARRSIRRALNRQIRDSALNPATRHENFFARPSDERAMGATDDAAATAPRNPARPTPAFKTAIDAVTCSGPMS